MMEEPKELYIIKDDKNIFTSGDTYIIPLYQRAFAWGYKELHQLIEDIYYFEDSDKYFLGSLIVSRKEGSFEVIDGQQRLTALYLLLACLGYQVDKSLTFARRERSNYTLANLSRLISDVNALDGKNVEETISVGFSIIKEELSKKLYDKDELKRKLKKVVLYRIEVPAHTDLNRYFEIMNTRGEQLEQHDIIKALLMGYYAEGEIYEKAMFADIWEACSDMTGYAQMHYSSDLRRWLYDKCWDRLPTEESYKDALDNYKKKGNNEAQQQTFVKSDEPRISEIVKPDFVVETAVLDKDDVKVRFESIIDFPFFLIHCLKVYSKQNGLVASDGKALIPVLMNDKTLLDTFKRVIEFGLKDDEPLNKRDFANGFILHLVRMRYLFDRFIIKREYVDDKPDGEWSLKELRISDENKPYFANTVFHNYRGRKMSDTKRIALFNKMIQSALRVSFTSPKVMHWITDLLYWLADEENYTKKIETFDTQAERVAQNSVIKEFFNNFQGHRYEMGVDTPHIVFNYLDYLLWKKNIDIDFTFEFRNSVEHWYPRNPSNGTFSKWDDGVDRFGNLCLVPSNINSKFSNMSPESKKITFSNMIKTGSLKLRIMSDLTVNNGAELSSVNWKNSVCEKHEEEMITILKQACNITDEMNV